MIYKKGDDDLDLSNYLAKPDKTIEEHNQDLLERAYILKEYGYINDHLYQLLCKACFYHDLGKVNAEFQKRVRAIGKRIPFDEEKEVPHNILSMYFVDKDEFMDVQEYYKMLFAVGYHHNYGSVFYIIKENKELINQLLDGFPINKEARKPTTKNKIMKIQEEPEAILLKGLLHRCDYSASAEYPIEYRNDFLEQKLEMLLQSWRSKSVQKDRKIDWNALQHFCMDHQEENIIVVAQTGMGKTEASLLWAGNHKIMYILPIKTAINAMYDRIRSKILLDEKVDERLALLHSESLEYYMKQKEEEDKIVEYSAKSKQWSMPLTISTMDQVFDFVFKYQTYELKLATLSYCKVVVDEIQMYGPDLLAYLIAGLEAIHKMGGKIAIVTATLPPFVKELLTKKIPFKTDVFIEDNEKRHHVKLIEERINGDDILKLYQNNKQEGKANKILVVCNTVKEAQQIYGDLKKQLGEEEEVLHLLHSRYTKEDRSRLEGEIMEAGKTYGADGLQLDHRNEIWVSTSLVEASLDIDFDYLFTELQDLNSLFQRLGRCNRKAKKDVTQTNCFIYTEINPGLISGRDSFIDPCIYELSKEALLSQETRFEGIVSEQQKIELLERYFTTERMKKSNFIKKYHEIYNYITRIELYKEEKVDTKLRNITNKDVIPYPVFVKHKEEIQSAAEQLQRPELTMLERIKEKEHIKKYTVTIPYYSYNNYRKAVANNQAEHYGSIKINAYEEIPIMDCHYGKQGFEESDYKKRILDPFIL